MAPNTYMNIWLVEFRLFSRKQSFILLFKIFSSLKIILRTHCVAQVLLKSMTHWVAQVPIRTH